MHLGLKQTVFVVDNNIKRQRNSNYCNLENVFNIPEEFCVSSGSPFNHSLLALGLDGYFLYYLFNLLCFTYSTRMAQVLLEQ